VTKFQNTSKYYFSNNCITLFEDYSNDFDIIVKVIGCKKEISSWKIDLNNKFKEVICLDDDEQI
jgi:hypothetical protein